MRIGIDATGIWGIRGGLVNYTLHIVNNLIKIDNENTYYVYCRDEIPNHLSTRSASVTFRVFKSRNRKLTQQIQLPIAALFDRLDLIFFPFNSASILCPCKSVVTIHDLQPYVIPERYAKIHRSEIHGSSLGSMINKVYWKKILKIACKRADRIIAVSYATKRDIENFFHIPGEKIEVVYEGVDKEYFNIDSDGKDLASFREEYNLPERYILCVGTNAYKNTEGAIKSFSIIKKKCQDSVKLVIAGKNYLGAEIFQLVKDLKLENEIIFTGYFPNDDLKYLYQCAEVFLFPSYYEGFGLPVLEAFACGTPVVTSTTEGALPEVAGEAAMLVDPNDPQEIASSVLALLTDRDLRDKKRQQGLKQVEEFSWEEAARKTLDIFEKMG